MNSRRKVSRSVLVSALLFAAALALSCGGGGGGGGGGSMGGLVPTFTAANPSPGANTLSMSPGTVTGDTFQVRILVTTINDFFGAAFFATYNTAVADFTGFSVAGSVVGPDGPTTSFNVDEVTPGVLDIQASRQGAGLAGIDVAGSQLLITLNFRALAASASSPLAFDTTRALAVDICPTAVDPCTRLTTSPPLTFSGGTLVVVSN